MLKQVENGRFAEAEPMLQASRDVCFRCFGEEQSLSDSSGRSVPSDRQRITPGHERILQSDVCPRLFESLWSGLPLTVAYRIRCKSFIKSGPST